LHARNGAAGGGGGEGGGRARELLSQSPVGGCVRLRPEARLSAASASHRRGVARPAGPAGSSPSRRRLDGGGPECPSRAFAGEERVASTHAGRRHTATALPAPGASQRQDAESATLAEITVSYRGPDATRRSRFANPTTPRLTGASRYRRPGPARHATITPDSGCIAGPKWVVARPGEARTRTFEARSRRSRRGVCEAATRSRPREHQHARET